MTLRDVASAAGKAFLISLVLTPIVRDVFRAYNLVDRPGRRKVHVYPTPRVGGIPIMVAYLFALWGLLFVTPVPRAIWRLGPGAAVIFIVGLADDFLNLNARVKLVGQIAAALLAFSYGLRFETVAGMSLPLWAALPLTVIWLLLTTNALNLIDGLDGLCAGMGFFAAVALFFAALLQHNDPLAYAALPLAAAILGFVFYNFNPATVFMGDSGALSVGFLLGCMGLEWMERPTTLAAALAPLPALAVPFLDVALAIARRTIRGQHVFTADRGHVHHRLLARGLSVRRSAFALYGMAAVGGAFAVLLAYRPLLPGYHAAALAAFAIACQLGIRQLRYPEFVVAKRFLFGGEFRRAFGAKLRLEQLADSLRSARTDDAWWNALAEAAETAGWTRISWRGGASRERTFPGPADWSFGVPLGGGEEIRIEGAASSGAQPIDLAGLSSVLRETLGARRAL